MHLAELDELYRVRFERRGRAAARRWYLGQCAAYWLRVSWRRWRRRWGGAGREAGSSDGGASGPKAGRRLLHESIGSDTRLAVRSLMRQPGHAVAAILTIGLSMAGAVSVYAVANWVLLRPVPGVRAPDELATVRLESTAAETMHWPISEPDFRAVAAGLRSAAGVAAVLPQDVHLTPPDGAPVRIPAQGVTANFFELLGVRLSAGRGFISSEDAPTAEAVIVSKRLRERYGGEGALDPGSTVRINGRPFTVVGVAPAGFHGAELPGAAELWFPAGAVPLVLGDPRILERQGAQLWSQMIVRLRPDADAAGLAEELAYGMEAVRRRGGTHSFLASHFVFRVHGGIGLSPTHAARVERTLGLLGAASVLLFLLGVANAMNLGLARTVSLGPALGIRRALGASGWRIARERLVESLVVGVAGSAVGLAGAGVIARTFEGSSVVPGATALTGVQLDGRVLAFAVAAALFAGALAGVLPAYTATRADGATLLRSMRHGHRRGRRLRDALVVTQVALSVVLVVGAGLFARTLWNLRRIDLGIDVEPVLTFVVDPAIHGYDGGRTHRLVNEVVRRLSSEPGVDAAGALYMGAFDHFFIPLSVMPAGGRWGEHGISPRSFRVAGDAFGALGLRVVAGRALTAGEVSAPDSAVADVVVLNESAARALFPDRSPAGAVGAVLCGPDTLGEDAGCGDSAADAAITVVGVVADARLGTVTEPDEPIAFLPWSLRFAPEGATFYVRSTGAPLSLAEPIRRVLSALDPDLPPYALGRLRATVDTQLAEQRFVAGLSLMLGLLAVVLAAGGLYATLAYAVAARTREIGIRSALGARPIRILRQVVGAGVGRTAIGIAVGLVAAAASSRLVEARLFGVARLDAPTYAAGSALLLLVAVIAAGVPGRRALRIDPVAALRRDD